MSSATAVREVAPPNRPRAGRPSSPSIVVNPAPAVRVLSRKGSVVFLVVGSFLVGLWLTNLLC